MVILDLNINLKGLDGLEMPGDNIAKLLANLLSGKNDPNIPAAKAMAWAFELHNNGKIELDKSDLESLEKMIERLNKEGILFNIAAAPLLASIKKLRNVDG